MKYLALTIAAVGMLASQSRPQCIPIYDTITGASSIHFDGAPGNERMADNFLPPPPPPPGTGWQICDVSVVVIALGGATNFDLTVNLWGSVGNMPCTFVNLFSTQTQTIALPAAGAWLVTSTGWNYCIPYPPGPNGYGIEVISSRPSAVTFGFVNNPCQPPGSAWSDGLFVDDNQNGCLENTEFYVYSLPPPSTAWNLAVEITAIGCIASSSLIPAFNVDQPNVKIEPLPNMQIKPLKRMLPQLNGSNNAFTLKTK